MTVFVEPLAQARFPSELTVAKLSIIHTSCILRCREECEVVFTENFPMSRTSWSLVESEADGIVTE